MQKRCQWKVIHILYSIALFFSILNEVSISGYGKHANKNILWIPHALIFYLF